MLAHARTVAQIVTAHPAAARIFRAHGIDYCCKGHFTLAEAARKKGLDEAGLRSEIEAAIAVRDETDDPTWDLPTPVLLERIVMRHHGFVRRTLPFLAPLAARVSRAHGDREPNLRKIADLVQELADLLLPHLDQEEQELFPILTSRDFDRAQVLRVLEGMLAEHFEVGRRLERLRRLTDSYVAPAWGCTSHRMLFAGLNELEADTLEHLHLENHVLLPRFT